MFYRISGHPKGFSPSGAAVLSGRWPSHGVPRMLVPGETSSSGGETLHSSWLVRGTAQFSGAPLVLLVVRGVRGGVLQDVASRSTMTAVCEEMRRRGDQLSASSNHWLSIHEETTGYRLSSDFDASCSRINTPSMEGTCRGCGASVDAKVFGGPGLGRDIRGLPC